MGVRHPGAEPPRLLPRLFVAALALAAGGLAPLDGAGLCAALGLLTLLCREGAALAPFVLAGHLAALDAARFPDRIDGIQESREACALVRTSGPAIENPDGSARQRVAIAIRNGRRDGDEVEGELLLPERALAPPRGWIARACGRWREASGAANPGGSAREATLSIATRSALDPITDDASPRERLLRAIDGVADAIERTFRARLAPTTAAFAEAVVLGRTARLDPELIRSLRATGAWHLLAVSGSHVALVAACTARALAAVALPAWCELVITLFATLGYALLTGAQAPAMRAALTFAGALPLLRGRRPAAPLAWLGTAFLTIVAVEPGALAEAGTQLSFMAVVALAVAARHGPARSPRGSGRGLDVAGALGRTLRYAVAAGLATLPLCVWHFGTAAPWSPVATLLLAPLVSIAMIAGLGAAALLPVVPAVALPIVTAPFEFVLARLADAVAGLGRALDALPLTPWSLPVPHGAAVVALVAVWIALLARRAGVALLLTLFAFVIESVARCEPTRAVLLAAGRGQTLVVQEAGRTRLVDCGGFGAPPASELRFARALRALGVERVDTLFLSHLDGDHAELASFVLDRFATREVIVAPPSFAELTRRDSAIGAALGRALEATTARVRSCAADDAVGGAEVLWPPGGREFGERNSGCLALQLTVGPLVLCAPGDLEDFPLLELAQHLNGDGHSGRARRNVDVLILPHHGNPDRALAPLLAALRPRLAIASRDTPLPPATREALRDLAIPWLSTHRGGAIALCDRGAPGGGLALARGAAAAEIGECFLGEARR